MKVKWPRVFFTLLVAGYLGGQWVPLAAQATVLINEAQSSNRGDILDGDNEASDWIELYNAGDQAVQLNGWGLSDNPDKPDKWHFPDCQLAAHAHLLVFASSKWVAHTNVELVVTSPQEIPGLCLWLRAEALVAQDGALIEQWTDLSGRGNHAIQATANARPSFVRHAVNQRAALKFTRDNENDLRLPVQDFQGLEALQNVSIFMVFRWGGKATSGLMGLWRAGSGVNAHFEATGNSTLRFRNSDMNDLQCANTLTVNTWCQVGALMKDSGDDPLATLFHNGGLCGTKVQAAGYYALNSFSDFAIGRSDSGGDRYFDGEIAEVILFDRALESDERQAIERMLADFYALPLHGNKGSELHTSFNLSAAGETLVLTRPDGSVADSLVLPALPKGVALGRVPDGGTEFKYFAEPTPGTANTTTPYPEVVLDLPTFTPPRGTYEASFSLALSHPDPGVSIYYTLDGSEPSVSHGTNYTTPLNINRSTIVRAVAYKASAAPYRAIQTHSYLFLADVAQQPQLPPGYLTKWDGYNASYGPSPYVMSQGQSTERLLQALKTLPILSLAAAHAELFGDNGIYPRATTRGLECVASAEWLTNGVGQVQQDVGLRAQGDASRKFVNSPKKSFRLLFRGALGPGRLREPVLAEGGSELADFNTLVLRAEYNNSWYHSDSGQRLRGSNVRDQWLRDVQIAMSGSGSHGTHVHLFLNGLYWGVYNVSERPDAAFGANYFGGERLDYDAIKPTKVVDGNNVAWNAAKSLVGSDITTAAQYEALKKYLDLEHFVDYMIVNLYGGNEDWPHKNWTAVRLRQEEAGWKFYCWDIERTLEGVDVNKTTVSNSDGPALFYSRLRNYAEFRLLFADRVQRHFFNGGILTPAVASAGYQARAALVRDALFGEAARWGAYRHEQRDANIPGYDMNTWSNEYNRLINSYFPQRSDKVLAQLKGIGLYPSVAAPVFSQHGGTVARAATLSLSAPQGQIWMTFNGSDPRVAYTGAVASKAALFTQPFAVTTLQTIKARALYNGTWSALAVADFMPEPLDYSALRVVEILAKPQGDDNYAWLNLVNTGTEALDLSGIYIEDAVRWSAPELILAPGENLVLTKNSVAFESRYGVLENAQVYEYSANLAAKGEPVTLMTPYGQPFFSFTYDYAWYPGTFEAGHSLVARDLQAPEALWSTAANWRPSDTLHGTPATSEVPYFVAGETQLLQLTEHTLKFQARGLEQGCALYWSVDLKVWTRCEPTALTLEDDLIILDLTQAGIDSPRCFFRLVNP